MLTDLQVQAAVPEGGFLFEFMRYATTVCDGPHAYGLAAGLSTLAQLIPEHVEMRLGGRLSPTFWALLVGPSGTRKSSMVGAATEILKEVSPEKVGTPPESDAALVESLQRSPQQMILFSEFGSFLASTSSKNGYKAGLRAKLTEVWDGQPLKKESKAGGVTGTDRPRLSVLAAVAPPFIEQHSTIDDWTNGFFPRFAVLYTQQSREILIPPDWPEQRKALIGHLKTLKEKKIGPLTGLSPEAYTYLADWNTGIRKHYTPLMERLPHLHGFASRALSMALRTAMIYSFDCGAGITNNGAPWRIGVKEMEFACRFVELHMFSVYALAKDIAMSPHERIRRAIVKTLEHGPCSGPIIARTLKPRVPKFEFMKAVEALLYEEEIIEGVLGGVLTYALNPARSASAAQEAPDLQSPQLPEEDEDLWAPISWE